MVPVPQTAPTAPPLHSERLWPGIGLWLLSGSLVVGLGVAYGAAFGARFGWLVACASGALALGLIARGAPRIVVDARGLGAGPALLPWGATGRVLALDAEQAHLARGTGADPTAYLVLRPGVGPGAVVVEVVDDSDPHRTWLLASRDAPALARAIEAARGRLAP